MKNLSEGARSPARILVVEDNAADVYLLRHSLDQHNDDYVLEVLSDGAEAILFVHEEKKRKQPKPCAVVLDLHLPKCDGGTVLEAIRREPTLAHLQVVALTSLANPAEELELRNLGVRLYRTKPSNLDGWVALAAEILAICRDAAIPA